MINILHKENFYHNYEFVFTLIIFTNSNYKSSEIENTIFTSHIDNIESFDACIPDASFPKNKFKNYTKKDFSKFSKNFVSDFHIRMYEYNKKYKNLTL